MKDKTEFQKRMDELKEKIGGISKAFVGLKKTGISEDVLFKIIRDAANSHYSAPNYGNRNPITIKLIRAVVEGVQGLEEYVFPKEDL